MLDYSNFLIQTVPFIVPNPICQACTAMPKCITITFFFPKKEILRVWHSTSSMMALRDEMNGVNEEIYDLVNSFPEGSNRVICSNKIILIDRKFRWHILDIWVPVGFKFNGAYYLEVGDLNLFMDNGVLVALAPMAPTPKSSVLS